MLELIQRLIEAWKSEKTDSGRIPVLLCVIGTLLIFMSDKIPSDVAEKVVVQALGGLVLSIGCVLFVVMIVSDTFGVPILSGASDGMLSGLTSSLLVSIFFFAPINDARDGNFFLYRVSITIAYGMIYGGLLGVFTSFFVVGSKVDRLKAHTAVISAYILAVFLLSKYLGPNIPVVPEGPIEAGDLFLVHVAYIVFFLILFFRSLRLRRYFWPLCAFISSTSAIVVALILVGQEVFYPVGAFSEGASMWSLVFYQDTDFSEYAFATLLSLFGIYASANIIFSIRIIERIEG